MSFAAPKTAPQAPVVHDLLYLELGDPRCRPPSFTFKRTSMEGFTASRRRARLERCPLVRASPCHGRADRKSTRLNSSHTVISYAVFCLKKKKKAGRTRHK